MFVRISCRGCRLKDLWTDEPVSFLQDVCLRAHHCEAVLREEPFASQPAETLPVLPVVPENLRSAYEIRSLLGVVLGYSAAVRQHLAEAGDESQDRFLEAIGRAAARVLEVMRPVLEGEKGEPEEAETAGTERRSGVEVRPGVLVVEDDPDTQAIMKLALRDRYEVRVAASAAEARSVLEHEAVRIVLMDISLSGEEDGLTLTRTLRRDPRWRRLPIIATTAHALGEVRQEALAAGCNEFLSKPFSRGRLLSAMAERLS